MDTEHMHSKNAIVFAANPEYFYFIANGGRIQFSTDSNETNFGFIVSWDRYPTNSFAEGRVKVSDTQPFLTAPAVGGSILINAETKVSATIMSSLNHYRSHWLRRFIFFDGPNYNNTKSLGTGLQLLNGNTQYVSTGNSMTVLILDYPFDDIIWFVFQDYELTKNIKRFQGADCYDVYCTAFNLDATNGPAALQVYNDNDVISGLSGSGKLEVYFGTASQNKTNLVATYHVCESNSSLPQPVFGYFKTFLLTDGNATITFNDIMRSDEIFKSVGSTGFISSDNYGTYALQNRHVELYSSQNSIVKFRYSISQIDLVGDSWFQVSGDIYESSHWFKYYNASNPPKLNSYEEFYGKEMNVSYGNSNLWSKGFLMTYEVEKNSNRIFMFSIFALVLIVYFD
ncbi:unnamed protein product [Caenorhabditis nigoni]